MPEPNSPPRADHGRASTRIGAAAVTIGVVVAVVVAVLVWPRGPSQAQPMTATTPTTATAATTPTTLQTPQARLGPVILVPGYGGGTGSLNALAARLDAAGRTTTVLALAGDGTGDLLVEARRLSAAVAAAMAGGAPSVDVVGYSAGGVVTRLWASELGGAVHARRIVLLGSPNHGTDLAALGAAIGGALCPAACQQLAPGSDLLTTLNAGPLTDAGPQWVSIWSSQDQVVTPPGSARLDGALNIVVQNVCPGVAVDHGSLPTNPTMKGLVLRALALPEMSAPAAADCAALTALGAG